VAHQTVPNLVIAPVGANGMVALESDSPGTVQLVADVSGWFLDNTVVPGPVINVAAITTTTTIGLSWTNPPQASLTGVLIRRAAGPTPRRRRPTGRWWRMWPSRPPRSPTPA
jgi:hypothetical protein